MLFEHLWSENFSIKMTYETKVFDSFFKKEQRRALRGRSRPKIEITKRLTVEESEARQLLMKNYNSYVYVPIDTESFTGSRGSNKITPSSSISNLFFLNNLSNVYVIDEDNNTAKVTSISGGIVNLMANISGTSNTFFTCVKCFVKSLPFDYDTDTMVTLSVTFEQVREA